MYTLFTYSFIDALININIYKYYVNNVPMLLPISGLLINNVLIFAAIMHACMKAQIVITPLVLE